MVEIATVVANIVVNLLRVVLNSEPDFQTSILISIKNNCSFTLTNPTTYSEEESITPPNPTIAPNADLSPA